MGNFFRFLNLPALFAALAIMSPALQANDIVDVKDYKYNPCKTCDPCNTCNPCKTCKPCKCPKPPKDNCCKCAPQVPALLLSNTTYADEYSVLKNINLIQIEVDIQALLSSQTQANYQKLLADAHQIVLQMNAKNPVLYPFVGDVTNGLNPANHFYTTPRIVIAQADGTVIVDTGRSSGSISTADPLFNFLTAVPALNTNTYAGSGSGNKLTTGNSGNSLINWQNRNVNENHNTRISISNAQHFPCGIGVETKFSSTTNTNQAYVALRAGVFLDSQGTVRISVNQ